jgi:hypothetical protein
VIERSKEEPMRLLVLFVLASMMFAQPLPQANVLTPGTEQTVFDVTASVSLMPLEAWKSTMVGKPKGLALYEVLTCNHAPNKTIKVQGGRVLYSIRGGVIPINSALAIISAGKAKRNSTLWKIMKVTEWAAWGATFLFTSGAISIDASAVIAPIVASGSAKLANEFRGQGINEPLLREILLEERETFVLEPKTCSAQIILGQYKGQLTSFTVPVQ